MSDAAAAATGAASPEPMADELKALDDLCDRLAGFGAEVDTEWLDGFFAALVAGPKLVAPDEWLPLAFDDAFDRAFADPEDRERALGVLLAHHARVAAMLDPQRLLADESVLHYAPVMLEWNDESRAEMVADGVVDAEEAAVMQTGDEWAHGFFYAVRVFGDDWAGHGMNREERALLDDCLEAIGMLVAEPDRRAFDDRVRRVYGGRPPGRETLIDHACVAVQDLRLLWFEHRARPQPRHVPQAPGRNDPCPCGSGKKYKKCCGAAA